MWTPTLAPAQDASPRGDQATGDDATPAVMGYLSVDARPQAEVYIDGARVATETPLSRHALVAGNHTVRVFYVDRQAFSETRRALVHEGRHVSLFFEERVSPSPPPEPGADPGADAAQGTLRVTANRPAQVYVDGQLITREAPLEEHALLVGEHTVRVYYGEDRAFSETRRVHVEEGADVSVHFEQGATRPAVTPRPPVEEGADVSVHIEHGATRPAVTPRPPSGAVGARLDVPPEVYGPDAVRALDATRYAVSAALVSAAREDARVLNLNQNASYRPARLVPNLQSGRLVGLRLLGMRRNTVMTRLGLRNGDILMTVNGEAIAAPNDAFRFVTDLAPGEPTTLTLKRRGRTMHLSYERMAPDAP